MKSMARSTCSAYSQQNSVSSSYLLLTPWVTTSLQPNTSLAVPLTIYSLWFRNSRDTKMPTIPSRYRLPWSSKPAPFQNKLFNSLLLPWICCPDTVLILATEKSEKSRGVKTRFCSKDNMPEPLVQVIQPPAFLSSCPVSLFKDLQGIWVMFLWGYLITGLSSSL